MRGATQIIHVVHAFDAISIHTPHAGSDLLRLFNGSFINGFQSTLPMRGATSHSLISMYSQVFQSTLPMRGATYFLRYKSS